MEDFNRDNSEIFSMDVDDHAKVTFLEMARWTKFLAILGFISLGLVVIAGIFVGMLSSSSAFSSQLGALGSMGAIGIILYFIVIAAIMFYPAFALLKYSTGMKTALKTNNKQKFNEAIGYLKNMFKYYGIIAIIFLGLYGIIVIIGVLAAMGK